jgi:hypothetical protein
MTRCAASSCVSCARRMHVASSADVALPAPLPRCAAPWAAVPRSLLLHVALMLRIGCARAAQGRVDCGQLVSVRLHMRWSQQVQQAEWDNQMRVWWSPQGRGTRGWESWDTLPFARWSTWSTKAHMVASLLLSSYSEVCVLRSSCSKQRTAMHSNTTDHLVCCTHAATSSCRAIVL